MELTYMEIVKKSNTKVQFIFDSEEQRNIVIKATSYKVPGHEHSAAFQTGLWNGTKMFLTATNTLSMGLFKSLFMEHALVFNSEHVPLVFDDIPLYKQCPELDRRQYQLDAINAVFQHRFGLLNAVMGSGKSLISAAVISYHLNQNVNNKVLVVCYDTNILEQLYATYKTFNCFSVSKFGNGIKDLSGQVVVATIQSLSNILKPSIVLKNISFVIVDEAHHGKAKTSKSVITKLINCKYFIGLTATPHPPKSLALAELTSVLGPIIYDYKYAEATNDNKIVPVKAFFLDGPIDYDVKNVVFERKSYKLVWDAAIQYNKFRNATIGTILNSLVDVLDTSNIVLVDRVEHGTSLTTSLAQHNKLNSIAMFGDDDILMRNIKKNKLMSENINTLVSSVISEGVDFKISPVVAVNASGRKGFIQLIQFLGRITRPNKKFKSFRVLIDFVDRYNPLLLHHSQERMKACENFGLTVVVCKSVQELLIEIVRYYNSCRQS